MMLRALHSEWLKHRHTFSWTLVALGPLSLALISGLALPLRDQPASWSQLFSLVSTWWPALWIPFGAALLAALAAWHDARGDAWRGLRVRPAQPAALYVAKLLVLSAQALAASCLLGCLLLGIGLLAVGRGQPVPLAALSLGVLLPALAALPLLAIHLWLATAWGFAPAFALSVGGFIAGLVGSRMGFWPLIPWAWPIRVGTSVAGLGAAAPSVPSEAVVTLGVALAAALVVGTASAWWFDRWEVR